MCKRTTATIAAGILLFSLCGCSGGESFVLRLDLAYLTGDALPSDNGMLVKSETE